VRDLDFRHVGISLVKDARRAKTRGRRGYSTGLGGMKAAISALVPSEK
jgi:hypothetical protein